MNFLIYCFFCLLYFYAQLLPLRWLMALGRVLGSVYYAVDFRRRRVVLRNLRIAFGDRMKPEKRRALARESYRRVGASFLSMIKLANMSYEAKCKLVELRGEEAIISQIKAGKGVVLLTGHIGNWELFAHGATMLKGVTVSTIYQRLSNPWMEKAVLTLRQSATIDFIEKREAWTKSIEKLKRAEAVNILADQHAGDQGLWTPFFGRLASTTPAVALMARKTGAVIAPATCFYEVSSGKWIMESKPQVPTQDANGKPLSTGEITHACNLALESIIREHPEDYFWMHNRWKTPAPNFLLSHYKRGVFVPQNAALQPFKILIRTPNWLGDAVMSLPAVARYKNGRPDAKITILCPLKLADLWKACALVDEVMTFTDRESANDIALRLERECFDVAVTFPNSFTSALPAFFAEIPMRVGYRGFWRKWLLTEIIPENRRRKSEEHQSHDYLGLASANGADDSSFPPTLVFDSPLEAFGLPSDKPWVVINANAEYGPAKRWPESRFSEACQGIAARLDAHFIFVGLKGDAARHQAIMQESGIHATDLAGKTTLAELGSLLKKAAVVISNDSGTMHLAAAVGTKTVAIFGSTEPQLTGPLGTGHRIIRRHAECSPCFLRECPLDFRCMTAIESDEVSRAALELMALKPV